MAYEKYKSMYAYMRKRINCELSKRFKFKHTNKLRVKKKREKTDKYLDLTRELKMLWNMKMTMIPCIVSVIRTIAKGLERKQPELLENR